MSIVLYSQILILTLQFMIWNQFLEVSAFFILLMTIVLVFLIENVKLMAHWGKGGPIYNLSVLRLDLVIIWVIN